MDPNEALHDARQACREVSQLLDLLARSPGAAPPPALTTDLTDATAGLIDTFSHLDDWMNAGGYPPADWERRPARKVCGCCIDNECECEGKQLRTDGEI